jgi:hypothetical protein
VLLVAVLVVVVVVMEEEEEEDEEEEEEEQLETLRSSPQGKTQKNCPPLKNGLIITKISCIFFITHAQT